jgi:hypothetical protein
MIVNKDWLSLKQTMAYLQCGKTTVYSIARKYNIRQSKLLSMPYFSKEDIDKVFEANAVQMGICNNN